MNSLQQLLNAVRIAAAGRLSRFGNALQEALPLPQFAGQHYATEEKKKRRALVKVAGRRQARKINRLRNSLKQAAENAD